jgi:sporulation protein YlmC with PRC-barrel domain
MLQRMMRSNVVRGLILTGLGFAVMATSLGYSSEAASDAKLRKASDWLGHAVTTRDGKELGTVRDFAIDERSGKVVYVVVSVGSFLIENNLIAVAPDALVPSRLNDSVLELDADPNALVKAQRFASDSRWPAKAEVLRGDGHALAASGGAAAVPSETVATSPTASPTGSATIESRSKTAHLSASERYIKDAALPPAPPAAATGSKSAPATSAPKQARLEPITKFDRLDADGDGVLNRSEFAPVISPGDRYGKIDANADGVIQPQEFDAYEQAHTAGN